MPTRGAAALECARPSGAARHGVASCAGSAAGRPVSARNTSSRLGLPTENWATSILSVGQRERTPAAWAGFSSRAATSLGSLTGKSPSPRIRATSSRACGR